MLKQSFNTLQEEGIPSKLQSIVTSNSHWLLRNHLLNGLELKTHSCQQGFKYQVSWRGMSDLRVDLSWPSTHDLHKYRQ